MFQQIASGKLKNILIASAVVQFLGLCIFLLAFFQQQKLLETSVLESFIGNVEQLESEMTWSAGCLDDFSAEVALLHTDPNFKEIDQVKELGELRRIFYILRTVSNRDYNFFLYSVEGSRFLELTTVTIPFVEYLPVRDYLKAHLYELPSEIWTLETIAHNNVIFYSCNYGSFYIGTWIREQDFLKETNSGTDYSAALQLLTVQPAESCGMFPFSDKNISHSLNVSATNFRMELTIPADRQLVTLAVIQLIQLVIWLEILVVLICFASVINKNLLRPIRNLRDVLSKYQVTRAELPASAIDLNETIDDAYQILGALGQQVDNLSAEMYQQELEMKKVELNFRNLQIRPHFFINCLSMISGMAQVNDTAEIKKVLVDLANYFRYILHDCMNMVTVAEEIAHIHCLIQIRSRINQNSIIFEEDVSQEAENEQIPVLLLATLAENSIRCSYGDEKETRLLLQVWTEADLLHICFTDNGPGMDTQLMEDINAGQWDREEESFHIGISNLLKRMSLLYGESASIRYSRDREDLKGTRVEITIRQED